jgi:PAS domain S-box-containing protein
MALCAGPTAASNEQGVGANHTVVGGEYDYPPYSSLKANGEASGFNSELTRAIAAKMGLDIEIKLGPWAEIRKALEDGKIDAIQGMFYSEKRAQAFDFSPPFAIINHVVFGRKGSPAVRSTKELRDKEIIVMQGDIMHDYVVKKHLSDRLLLAPTPADVLRLLASGKGDYALVAELPALYWIKELKLSNLTIVGPAIEPSKYCYAVKKGDIILLSRFTEGLKILQQTGEYGELYEKWLGVLEPSQINKKLAVKYVAIALVPMAMLLAVSLLWSRMLRKKVNQKTKELQESEKRFRMLAENARDMIYRMSLPDGRYEYVSPASTELFGYAPEEFKNSPMLIQKVIHPDWHGYFEEQWTKLLAGDMKPVYEYQIIDRSGVTRWLFQRNTLIRDSDGRPIAIEGIVTDITERKRAEEALRKSEKFIKDILSSVDEAFVVVDREFRILSANRAYCEQAGKTVESIIGRHCYEISHHATQPCHEPEHVCGCMRTFETGEPAFTVHTHTDDKGKQRQVEIKTYAMKDESGGVTSIIEVINDITEKTSLENQLRHAQKMEGIGTLAGGIAHDFNNILSAIIGYGHVTLMKMQKDDPLRMNIEHMLESADRAAALIQSLLTFSRKQIIERKPVDLNTILKKVEKFLVRVIGEDVEVSMALDKSVLTIYGDADQLEQVFMNLATNARDAMPNGGSFTIETSIIEIDSRFVTAHGYGKPGRYVMIVATDTGVGMNEETRKKIFEPFFTTKEVDKGTGLGLAIVYGIIKQHEGFINVYSEPGKGTTFRIYLPLIEAIADHEKNSVVFEYPKGGTETILLAEDDAHLRQLAAIVLEQMGYKVIAANDGEDAVTKFMENKDGIHLLLFDLIMPKKNGKEAFDEIRRIRPDIPVIFTSGYSPDLFQQKAPLEKGALLISKPLSPTMLLQKVRSVLDGKR